MVPVVMNQKHHRARLRERGPVRLQVQRLAAATHDEAVRVLHLQGQSPHAPFPGEWVGPAVIPKGRGRLLVPAGPRVGGGGRGGRRAAARAGAGGWGRRRGGRADGGAGGGGAAAATEAPGAPAAAGWGMRLRSLPLAQQP